MATLDHRVVTIHEAKTNLSKLLADVEAGQEVVIARGKTRIAKLVPIRGENARRAPGTLKGRIDIGPEFFEPISEEELALWHGDGEL
jgi:prevent-host-death family protein